MITKAVKDGDDYIINGSKIFTSNADPSGTYIVFANTDPTSETEGLSAFIIEKGTKGFTIGRPEKNGNTWPYCRAIKLS